MAAWAEYSTGERLALLRGEMTQEALAEAAGVSVQLVRKAEQDGSVKLASLLTLANALGASMSVVLGEQAPRRSMTRDDRLALRTISSAVHETALGHLPNVEPGTARELAGLRDAAWRAYWAGDYPEVAAILPGLLGESALRASVGGDDLAAVSAVLADAYQVAACVANMLGSRDLAYGATAYGRAAALRSGDPVLVAALESMLSWVYLRDAQADKAQSTAEAAALSIEPAFSKSPAGQLAVFGNLMLQASVAAARRGEGDRANDYLSQGHAASARLGMDVNLYQCEFGPSKSGRTAVQVAMSLGETGRALDLIDHLRIPEDTPLIPRARYLLDVAWTYCEARRWDASADTLLEICEIAPRWVRHQAMPGVIAGKLAEVSTSKVRRITRAAGIPLVLK